MKERNVCNLVIFTTRLHVHQIYPYLYIKYSGSLENINNECNQLARKIDNYIQTQFPNRNKFVRSVLAVIPVKGIPFYGFHPSYVTFLKIYLLNPITMGKVVNAIETGAVCEKQAVYESHIPYLLQFLVKSKDDFDQRLIIICMEWIISIYLL